MKTSTEESEAPDQPALTSVVGVGPADGRLAHRATQGITRGVPAPKSRLETENELVGFVCDLLQAPDTAVGTISGGLHESALMVLRAARDARPHLRRPSVVLPQSAHPAWFAAAADVGVTPAVAPVSIDGSVEVGPMTALIRDQTVLVVASAPSYTHGRVDHVAWIAAASAAHAVPLHVDASSGGWALAYAELAGRLRQPWGFAVPGVSSITLDVGPDRGTSADVSMLVHREPAERRAVHASALASRGPLDSDVAWSAPSAVVAELTETLREVGHLRCAGLSLDALDATAELAAGLVGARGITLVAQPDATTLVLRADATCDAFVFADALHHRGWTASPFFPDQGPPMLRFAVTAAMLPLVPQCLAAMDDAVSEARARGRARVDPTLQRLLEKLDAHDVSEYAAELLLDAAAVLDESDSDEPERRQATNLLLKAAPPEIRELLLTYQRDRLSRPVRRGSPILTFAPATDED
ncbi:aminotransferase class V-fold PLP-dependent enzyme [Nocardioides sp.]|uniref:aminotransferase class V-fold PLP-dependent enzyme n=1 Tax=Nocardioides sp. TaxID=35761 RepID=UPI002B274B22|nr:aminotransferase class V-fold PLP-dependent enzyme [Nocardioides sp.]